MKSINLPPTSRSLCPNATKHLETTGLAIEYFPTYSDENDEFHTHEYVEFLFVLGGSVQHVTGNHTYNEEAGRMAIINYNQFHCFKIPDGPFELMNIYWEPQKYHIQNLPEPLFSQLQNLIPAHAMLGHRLNGIVRLQLKRPEEIEYLLHRFLKEQNEGGAGSELAIVSLFNLLLIEICRSASIIPASHEAEFNPRMEKIRTYLEKHYTEAIRIEQLCELSKFKEANLCRQFKKYTSLSIGNYLKQHRLANAMQQLRTTNKKILTICHDCGFSDITYFNRIFRAGVKNSPSEYRKLFSENKK